MSFPCAGLCDFEEVSQDLWTCQLVPCDRLSGCADPLRVQWGPPRPGRIMNLVLRVLTQLGQRGEDPILAPFLPASLEASPFLRGLG